MREIVFDTETTGFDPDTGDRIVEIGAVELLNKLPTGATFHRHIDPERDVPAEAAAVHGLTTEFLRGKPKFVEICDDFMAFVGDAPLIAHNAAFDWRFLNAELARLGRPAVAWDRMVDTYAIARARMPGASASLDALCQRFGVDNTARDLHGALLDSQLLAAVYLELCGGRQSAMLLDAEVKADARQADSVVALVRRQPRPHPLPPRLTEAEDAAHLALIERLGPAAIWRRRLT